MEEKSSILPSFSEEAKRAYDEYISAVGEVAYHWNRLHEQLGLGLLFAQVVGTSQQIGLSIWYATKSDLAQRDMLAAALRVRAVEDPPWTTFAGASEDITWVINEIHTHLAERRNNAIHAPAEMHMVVAETPDKRMVRMLEIGPAFYYGNPRATKLRGKELLKEFAWYASHATVLKEYVEAMVGALSMLGATWPKRPLLPSLGQVLD